MFIILWDRRLNFDTELNRYLVCVRGAGSRWQKYMRKSNRSQNEYIDEKIHFSRSSRTQTQSE